MKLAIRQALVIFVAINIFFVSLTSAMKREKIEERTRSDKNKEKSTSDSKQFQSRTGGNDWGNGSVYFLDRHSLDCGAGKVLQGFHLYRPAWNLIAYEFACKNHLGVLGDTYNDQTRWNDTDGNERTSTNYLDRHDVRCRGGYALQQFKLIRNGRQIAYQYRCVQINSQNCVSARTNESWGNRNHSYENIYLDRQNVNAGDGRALTQFKLNSNYRNGGVFYTYEITHCQLANPVAAHRNPPQPSPRPVSPPQPYRRPISTPVSPPRPRVNPNLEEVVPKPNPAPKRNKGDGDFLERNVGSKK